MEAGAPRPGRPVRGSESGRPVMAALDLLGRRWTMRILWELNQAPPAGFRELQRRCERMSSSVLSTRIEELSAARLLASEGDGYRLTPPLGRDLVEALSRSRPGVDAGPRKWNPRCRESWNDHGTAGSCGSERRERHMGRRTAAVTATVREWYDEEGWGVLDSPETPPEGASATTPTSMPPPASAHCHQARRSTSPGKPPRLQAGRLRLPRGEHHPPSAPDIYGRRWIADEQETAGPRKASPAASVFSHFSGMDSGLL